MGRLLAGGEREGTGSIGAEEEVETAGRLGPQVDIVGAVALVVDHGAATDL